MKYELYKEVVLTKDIPDKSLKRGDIATVVEQHAAVEGEIGYTLEVFNALGDTIAVITVPESSIEPFNKNEIFAVRSLAVS